MKDLDVIDTKELRSEPPSELPSPVMKPLLSSSWSTAKKIYHTAVPCLFAFLMQVAASLVFGILLIDATAHSEPRFRGLHCPA
jgi:hypothetical protein